MTNDGPCKGAMCCARVPSPRISLLDVFSCDFSEMSCGDDGREKQWIGSGSGRVSPQDAECTCKNVECPLQEPMARKVAPVQPKQMIA